jgi:hypothetical protein
MPSTNSKRSLTHLQVEQDVGPQQLLAGQCVHRDQRCVGDDAVKVHGVSEYLRISLLHVSVFILARISRIPCQERACRDKKARGRYRFGPGLVASVENPSPQLLRRS